MLNARRDNPPALESGAEEEALRIDERQRPGSLHHIPLIVNLRGGKMESQLENLSLPSPFVREVSAPYTD